MSRPVIFTISAAWDQEASVWSGHCDDIPAAADAPTLDELLEKERDSNRPYFDLVERYFPLRDCEPEALLDVARKSRFLRSIQHNPRTNEYFIHFERGDAGGWFAYYATEKKSSTAGAGIRK